jgi:hypothetical protein
MFSILCFVAADISHIKSPPRNGLHSVYYTANIDVIFSFGLTELKAFIAWQENVRKNLVLESCTANKISLRTAGRREKVESFVMHPHKVVFS